MERQKRVPDGWLLFCCYHVQEESGTAVKHRKRRRPRPNENGYKEIKENGRICRP